MDVARGLSHCFLTAVRSATHSGRVSRLPRWRDLLDSARLNALEKRDVTVFLTVFVDEPVVLELDFFTLTVVGGPSVLDPMERSELSGQAPGTKYRSMTNRPDYGGQP